MRKKKKQKPLNEIPGVCSNPNECLKSTMASYPTARKCAPTVSKVLTVRSYSNHLSGIRRDYLQGRLQQREGQPVTLYNQSLPTPCVQGLFRVSLNVGQN